MLAYLSLFFYFVVYSTLIFYRCQLSSANVTCSTNPLSPPSTHRQPMSVYRPYYNADQFRYPDEAVAQSAGKVRMGFPLSAGRDSDTASFDYLDLDELVAGHSQISAVGISVSRFYARMLATQPFEVTRFLLQTGEFSPDAANDQTYDDYDFDEGSSSDEEVDYFVDVRDMAHREAHREAVSTEARPRPKPSKSRGVQLFNSRVKDPLFPQALNVSGGPFVFSTLGAIVEKEGVFGLWHAMNASCLYSAATGVVRAWSTSFLASIAGVPDPQFVDTLQAVDPMTLILVSTAGCALTAALLTPLAIIRARLIATSMNFSDRPRSLRWSLMDAVRKGQLLAPISAVFPTTLAASCYHLVKTSAPLIMWRTAGLSQFSSPKLHQLGQLVAKLLGLVVKMPLETLANRAQLRASHPSPRSLIIKPVQYTGFLPSLWSVVTGKTSVASLYRGWRTEAVGILAEWGYAALDDKPTQQERF